ncbi:MAG TPA: hypothetical protein DFI01_02485, partial [Bacteroidales bacterium]|nr:hypothetical protein [Bacteroidales bacterium]
DSRLTTSDGKFQSSPLPSTGTYYIKIPAYEKELRDLQPTSLTTGEKIIILEINFSRLFDFKGISIPETASEPTERHVNRNICRISDSFYLFVHTAGNTG